MNKIDKLLYETSERDRFKELAYFMLHKDLLENEFYNCIYQKLIDIESRDYSEEMIEMLTYITLDIQGKEKIETFKDNIDHLANLVKSEE